MSKPTPKPRPRPPPKPDISSLSNKPPLRPKPRRVPPQKPLVQNNPPPRPTKPSHLSKKSPSKSTSLDTKTTSSVKNAIVVADNEDDLSKIAKIGINNNEECTTTKLVDDELYDDVIIERKEPSNENEIEEDSNFYDDVIFNHSKEEDDVSEDNIYHDIADASDKSDGPNKVITNKPPPPKKPLPVLPAVKKLEQQSPKPCKESLSVKPTLAASRTSPHKSPLNAKNGNDGTDVVQGSSDKDKQKDQKPVTKPPKPPKPSWLQSDNKSNHDTSTKKPAGVTVGDKTVDVENIIYSDKLIFGDVTGDKQKDQKPVTKPRTAPKPSWSQGANKLNRHDTSTKKPVILAEVTVDDKTVDVENVIYSDKLIFGHVTDAVDDDNFNLNKPIKKRMATRRQNPGSTTPVTMTKTDAIKRRPPPPPPPESDDDSCSVARSNSLKGPSVPKVDHLTVNTGMPKSKSAECIPKTAEDQSLYSYAYEHTFLPVSVSSPGSKSPVFNTDEDTSYVEPDATIVAEVMEEIKTNSVSDGTYEVPEKELQSDSDSVDSQSDAEHDYEEPCDSPPPIPSRHSHRTGSYDITSPDNKNGCYDVTSPDNKTGSYDVTSPDNKTGSYDVTSPDNKTGSYDVTSPDNDDTEENDADDDSDDDEHDYCVPPDAKAPSYQDDFGIGSEDDDDFSENEFDDNAFLDEQSSVEEPLYQVYTARTLQRDKTLRRTRTNSNQADTSIEDITKGTLRNMRMLWCELPEVVSSGILESIDVNERKRQEAMFEVITSEASYLKSLNILENHFIKSNELTPGNPQCVIAKAQHHILFSNVSTVVETSQKFLDDLRQRSSSSLVVSSISDIIGEYASKHFAVYVKYCSNQIYQDRVFKELRKSPRFLEGVDRLEKCAVAQSLSLQSFLVLPMQRITRLPLLVDAICHRCEAGSEEFMKTDEALKAVHKVVRDCNEGTRKMERMEDMLALQPQIEFTVKPIALVSSNRWLLRRGEVVLVIEQLKSPISKKKMKLKPVYMFLFNDLLLITKKKGESRYRVLDYAYRNMTKVEESFDSSIQLDHMLSLILLENCNSKTKDFLLCFESETDKTRWLEAFNPLKAEKEGEKVYGDWDCPQVQAIHDYSPRQPDELALHEGDVINVQRKLPDGWHYGERLCDGVCGWFPANYTENIVNEHVRARNLLQRYRLLAASKHLIGAVQTMKTPKTSKLTLKSISSKRDTIS